MGLRRIINKSIVIGTLALSVVFSANCIYAANIESMENFETTKTYDDGMFNDVPSSAWYATGVKDAYEYGLMGGKAKGVFDPKGNITVAECIVVASRINAIYKTGDGSIAGVQGGAWYDGAVKYAKDNGIIKNGEFSNMKKLATRAEMLSILRRSLPFTDSDVINKVSKIPDMPSSNKYYADVLIMYNLGITGGSDTKGTSNYNNNITRAEAATMFVRMAEPSSRVRVDISNPEVTKPVVSEVTPNDKKITPEGYVMRHSWGDHTIEVTIQDREDLLNQVNNAFIPQGPLGIWNSWRSVRIDGSPSVSYMGYDAPDLYSVNCMVDRFLNIFKSLTEQEKSVIISKLDKIISYINALDKQCIKEVGKSYYRKQFTYGYVDDIVREAEATINRIKNAPVASKPTSITLNRTGNSTYKVITKYGTHTYGCANQVEYDAVVNIVEGVKNSDKYKDYVNQLVNNKSKRDEYLELKHLGDLNLSEQDAIDLGKMCILQGLTFQSLDGSKGMKTTSKGGDSAYNKLIERKTDCTGDAMVYSLIYDVAGFNTIVVGGHNHAWVRVQVSSGNWYANLGVSLKKDGGTFQFSLSSETFE